MKVVRAGPRGIVRLGRSITVVGVGNLLWLCLGGLVRRWCRRRLESREVELTRVEYVYRQEVGCLGRKRGGRMVGEVQRGRVVHPEVEGVNVDERLGRHAAQRAATDDCA